MSSPRRASTLLCVLLLVTALAACTKKNEPAIAVSPSADPWSEEGMLAEGARYLDDADFRRAAMVGSLANPTNTYSRQRLESYGLKTKAWDLLPEWNPRSVQVTTAMAEIVRSGRALPLHAGVAPLWDGTRPTTTAGWVTLGRQVFFGYPLRVEVFMDYALQHPDIGERVGVRAGADGVYPGIVLFADLDGKDHLGITCAICHTSVKDGRVLVGDARRAFDYGALRLAYHETTKTFVDPDLARRMKTWGPGRADVTEDDAEDPVAIPDLWGLKHQSFLTQAGSIKHTGPAALAIRQETQLLHSNHQRIRPPRALAFALAMYLYSLEPPPKEKAHDPALAQRGEELFTQQCRTCHSNEVLGGPPVSVERVGTDRALATGGARGTGKYRPPALLRVAASGPYFHHGAVATLEDVMSPERLDPSFARSPLGPGPVPGHQFGTELPQKDRAALVAFMQTL